MRHPHQHRPSFALRAMLGMVIIMLIAGTSYGIVQLQRSIDAMYQPVRTQDQPRAIVVGNPAHGRQLFNMTCFGCHGANGSGIPGLGANLRQSSFIRNRSDYQLITFIKMGRQPNDPYSQFHGMMPPKGGNPLLDDASLQDLVAYLRSF